MACIYCSGSRTVEDNYIADQHIQEYDACSSEIDTRDDGCVTIAMMSLGYRDGAESHGVMTLTVEGYYETYAVLELIGGEIPGTYSDELKIKVPVELVNTTFDINYCPICGEDLTKPKAIAEEQS